MSTADISGANNDAANPATTLSRPAVASASGHVPGLRHVMSSSRAFIIAALIFGLCGAFILTDIVTTEFAAKERVTLVVRMLSAALYTVEAEAVAASFEPLGQTLDAGIWVDISDRDGTNLISHGDSTASPLASILPDVTATRSIAGPLGTVKAGIGQHVILASVAWHALLALSLSGLVAMFALRRIALSDARQRARALSTAFAMTSDGAAIWDKDQRLIAANDALRQDTLLPPTLLRRGTTHRAFLDGLRALGTLTHTSTSRTGQHLSLVLSSGETWELQESWTADGLLVTRMSNDSERVRLKGEVAHLRNRIGEMADEVQTQRVRGDAASRSKTLFLGQLSHSLRTPLNHIIGFADLLRHQSYGPLGDARYHGYAANIKQSGEALLDMLANMLELAEFDSGHRVLNKETIRLAELFDWAEGRYREQATRAGIALVIERGDDSLLNGDRACLKRLIGNIVDNSLKFTPSGGSLTLAAWSTEDDVVLEFTDTGVGIAPDTLTVLNTSFALGTESNGNGIAIARSIAELSGGQLQINSSPGIGTTVAVVLPAKSVQKPSAQKSDMRSHNIEVA